MQDFPQLTGSEKQIRWAKSIRKQKSNEWLATLGDNPQHKQMLEEILQKNSAEWWISYRDSDLRSVLNLSQYGVDKVKQDREEYMKGMKTSGKKNVSSRSQCITKKPSAAFSRSADDDKFMMIGPTRNRFTGETVVSDDCPF